MRKVLLLIVMMAMFPLQEELRQGGAATPEDVSGRFPDSRPSPVSDLPSGDARLAFEYERFPAPAAGDGENGAVERTSVVQGESARPPDPAHAGTAGGYPLVFAAFLIGVLPGDSPGSPEDGAGYPGGERDYSVQGSGGNDQASGYPGGTTEHSSDHDAGDEADEPIVPELPALALFSIGFIGLMPFISRMRKL